MGTAARGKKKKLVWVIDGKKKKTNSMHRGQRSQGRREKSKKRVGKRRAPLKSGLTPLLFGKKTPKKKTDLARKKRA